MKFEIEERKYWVVTIDGVQFSCHSEFIVTKKNIIQQIVDGSLYNIKPIIGKYYVLRNRLRKVYEK